MNYSEEFKTVDAILNSSAETRAVDGFALSLIKAERQIRKLVTHLIFQFPCFASSDIPALRIALEKNRRVYFVGFENGFNTLYPKTISNLIGPQYAKLRSRINEAIDHRNKIFHGQLTSNFLSRDDLIAYVSDIREWCSQLAQGAVNEFQYDGFGRNSFQKSEIGDLATRFRHTISDIKGYERFIKSHMARP